MSEENGMSPSDVMAIMNNANGGPNGMWNNPFMYLIWLAIFGNGGLNGFGNGYNNINNSALQGSLTRAELVDGLNNQNVENDLRNISDEVKFVDSTVQKVGNGISQQMCSSFGNSNLSNANGFSDIRASILANTNRVNDSINGVGMSILANSNNLNNSIRDSTSQLGAAITCNTNGIVNAINQTAAAQQLANCNISHAIQDNKYEMAQNTTAITNAVHCEGELTRKTLIDQQIQNLRDSKEAVQRDLQSAQLALANAAQTQNILGSLGRYVAYSGCGSNCNCGTGF